MGIDTMGRVTVEATVENDSDLAKVAESALDAEHVRRVVVLDALIDTGATSLSMPARLIRQLGLRQLKTRRARTSGRVIDVRIFSSARLNIQGRDCVVDVTEVHDDCPVLISQVPLELLDFVVDVPQQRLIGNPAHGGEHQLELY